VSPLRLALLTPSAFPSVSGNAVTVGRIASGLAARGIEVRVWDLSAVPELAVADEVSRFSPGIVHAFHARLAGALGLRLARRARVPLVVTITGTDANVDLADPARAPAVRAALEGAAAVTVFHESMLARVAPAVAGGQARIAVVPQSVAFEAGAPVPAPAIPAGGPIVLFPAGIRAVKRPRFPIEPLEEVRARHPGLRLLYAGPIVDPEEGRALSRALGGRPWARCLGAVPHRAMPALLARADLVLNCSLAEGGMANSVLEALALGRAVLASAIDGNRSVIQDGVTGALYASEAEFVRRACDLLADPALRRRLGQGGRRWVETSLSPERELEGYLTVYRHLRPGREPSPGIDGA
jgi:glycosyltransferase involved in cell wall biosynthesis